MEKPENQLMNIIKINQNIKRNLFGLSFCDKKIEKEYLATEMKINRNIKIIMHFSYILNHIFKLTQGRLKTVLLSFVISIILFIIYLILIICYYSCKNVKKKKFFDQASGYLNYIYQFIFIAQLTIYTELADEVQRIKSLHMLSLMSILEILFSYELSIIFPFFILFSNVGLSTYIFIKFDEMERNFPMVFSQTIVIIACILYKRFINELNRTNFLQQYIFRKYSLYYFHLINNMNGFLFTMREEKVLIHNENFKSEVLNDTSFCNYFALEEKYLISKKSENANQIDDYNFNKYSNNDNNPIIGKNFCSNYSENFKNQLKDNKELQKNIVICENSLIKENIEKSDFILNNSNNTQPNNENIVNYNNTNNFLKSNNENSENKQITNKNESQITLKFMHSLTTNNSEQKDSFGLLSKDKRLSLFEIYKSIEKSENASLPEAQAQHEKKTLPKNQRNFNSKKSINNSADDNIIHASNKFKYLGEFVSAYDSNVYEVYFRHLKEYDNIVDFSIYKITKIKEAERVKAENEIKNKFFAKIAHEFKTPINSILGLIAKIKSKLELYVEDFYTIKNELNQVDMLSNYTIYLIHDIVDYSNNIKKIVGYNIQSESLNIKEIIGFCKGVLETLLISKGKENRIKVETENDLLIERNLVLVDSDNFRIKQILLNFISNAVKFTKFGYIKLQTEVKFESVGEINNTNRQEMNVNNNNNQQFSIDETLNLNVNINLNSANTNQKPYLLISVIDTGIGIEKSAIKSIFDEDKKFEAKDYNSEGSGLGLSIAKYLSEALKLQIIVDSEYGKGSRFALKLDCSVVYWSSKNTIFYDLKNQLSDDNDNDCYNSNENDDKKISESEGIIEYYDVLKNLDSKSINKINEIETNNQLNNSSELNDVNKNLNKSKENFSYCSGISNSTKKLDDLHIFLSNSERDFNWNIIKSSSTVQMNYNNNEANKVNYFESNSYESFLLREKSFSDLNSQISASFSKKNFDSITVKSKFYESARYSKNNIRKDYNFVKSLQNFNTYGIFKKNKKNGLKSLLKISAKNHKKEVAIESNANLLDTEGSLEIRKKVPEKNHTVKDNNNINNDFKVIQENSKIVKLQKDFTNNYNKNKNKIFNKISILGNKNTIEKEEEEEEDQNDNIIIKNKIQKNTKKNKILVVDDHKLIRDSLVILVKKSLKNLNKTEDYEIIEGSDGNDILCNLISDQEQGCLIKFVITDENMEYINGSEAVAIIRRLEINKKIKRVPIASISAFEDEYSKNKMKNSGVDVILSKPCSEEKMRSFLVEFNII